MGGNVWAAMAKNKARVAALSGENAKLREQVAAMEKRIERLESDNDSLREELTDQCKS